jgi:hypothetical protein
MKLAEAKLNESKQAKIKPSVDQAHFTKGKNGKQGSPKGQRNWVGQDVQWPNWQQPTYWDQSPQQAWVGSPNQANWQSPVQPKGKGKQPSRTKLWCDIHQAYGHSTDWCFDNPNKSGGPPK